MNNKNLNLEHGKLPPQAIDLEETVLGAMLLEKVGVFKARKILKADSFYKEAHQKIFQACLELDDQNEPVDILTVTNKLKTKGELEVVGGPYYITQLTNRVSSAANIEYHCMIIKQAEIKRRHIALGSDVISMGYDETVDFTKINEHITTEMHELLNPVQSDHQQTNSEIIREMLHDMEEAAKSKGITGVKTGFAEQDSITGGWQDGDLIYIAARPSMGKTAKILCEAKFMALNQKKHVAFFSLEMKTKKLMMRMASSETEIPFSKLRKGDMDANELHQFHAKIDPLCGDKLHLFDVNTAKSIKTIHGIKSKCLELHMEGKLDVIMIDYLQLIEYPEYSKNREQEVSRISRTLKLLAEELSVPLICLSQLSREVEKRPNKKPQLSDLRDSGSVEQDADVVMFLFRPSYYNIPDAPDDLALGLLRKHRNGDLATLKFKFEGQFVRFTDYESGESNQFSDGTDDDLPF